MLLNGFSAAHAILVQTQMLFTILIKGLDRPALQIRGDNPVSTPVRAVGHQDRRRAGQVGLLETDHQPDFAQAGNAHGQSKGPVRLVVHGDRAIGAGGDERH